MKEEQHKVRETGHPEWIRKAAGTDARDVRDSSDSTIPARDSNRYVSENYHASYSAIMDASIRQADRVGGLLKASLDVEAQGATRISTEAD